MRIDRAGIVESVGERQGTASRLVDFTIVGKRHRDHHRKNIGRSDASVVDNTAASGDIVARRNIGPVASATQRQHLVQRQRDTVCSDIETTGHIQRTRARYR